MIPHERLGELVTLNYFYAATVWWLYKGYDGSSRDINLIDYGMANEDRSILNR
jgi:hypothetical protein